MLTSQILREAQRILCEDGWFQGDYYDFPRFEAYEGPVCLLGAINRASGRLAHQDTGTNTRTLGLLAQCAVGSANNAGELLVEWNDHPDRSLAEVLAALGAAAMIAETDEHVSKAAKVYAKVSRQGSLSGTSARRA